MEKIRSSKQCKKCKSNSHYTQDEVWWDEHGTGYGTKLVSCSHCGCINVIKHSVDYGVDVNKDLRFYKYNKK